MPQKSPPPGKERGSVEMGVCGQWSDDVDLPCRDEVGTFDGTDLEQLLSVPGEVAACGIEKHAGVGSKAEDAITVVVEVFGFESGLSGGGDNGVAQVCAVVDEVAVLLLNGLASGVVGEGGSIDFEEIEAVESLGVGVVEALEGVEQDCVFAGFAGLSVETDGVLSVVVKEIDVVGARTTFNHGDALT